MRKTFLASAVAALLLGGAAGAQASEAQYVYLLPLKGLTAPPAAKAPASSPGLSVPASVYPGASYVVSWSASTGASRYDLSQQSAGGTVYSGADFSLSRSAPTVVGATDAYWVQACNAIGCAPMSSAQGVTVVAPPAPPAPAVTAPATAVAGDAISVQWSQSDDPNGYAVTYHAKMHVNSDADTSLFDGAGLSASVSNAVGGNTYTFTAQACNAYTCSVFSAPVTTVVPEPVCPTDPVVYAATGVGGTFTPYHFIVPQGCSAMAIVVTGGGGGSGKNPLSGWNGGRGGSKITGAIPVTAGDAVDLSVGAGGDAGVITDYCKSGAGGGGASTSLLLNGNYIVVAAGGGGGSCSNSTSESAGPSLDNSAPNPGVAGTGYSLMGINLPSYYSGLIGPTYKAGSSSSQGSKRFGAAGSVTITLQK